MYACVVYIHMVVQIPTEQSLRSWNLELKMFVSL